jgi:hypothetical protein
MSDSFTWRRSSGELGVIDTFTELARKASEEAGAEVTVVLNFPQGYLTVIASTPEEPAHQHAPWTVAWRPNSIRCVSILPVAPMPAFVQRQNPAHLLRSRPMPTLSLDVMISTAVMAPVLCLRAEPVLAFSRDRGRRRPSEAYY